MSDVRESLRSLTKNERPWAIRSHRSEKMSDSERIAQVVYQQWANEWIARFFEQIRNPSFAHFKKRAIRSANRWANSQPWPLGSSHEKTQDENCLFDSYGNCVNINFIFNAQYWTPFISEKSRNNRSKDDKIPLTRSSKMQRKDDKIPQTRSSKMQRKAAKQQYEKSFRIPSGFWKKLTTRPPVG